MRFVVIGDTHFCTREIRGPVPRSLDLAGTPDHVRYAAMKESVQTPLFAKVRELVPDLVISTGDFVEGGMSDPDKTSQEMREGWEFMRGLGAPCLIAKGTHEGSGQKHPGARAYRDIVLPGMSKAVGREVRTEYFRYDRDGCAFMLLDYLAWCPGNEQDQWLTAQLADATASARHIFLFAHPPIYTWGRHFFNEPAFCKRVSELCRAFPVDAYFCGHTHNQAVSTHAGRDGVFLQVMGSTVGYPAMGTVDLREEHVLGEYTDRDTFLWGVAEDSAPGFYLVEARDNALILEWHTLKGRQASLRVPGRCGPPTEVKTPAYRPWVRALADVDLDQVKAAWLHVYGMYRSPEGSRVAINNVELGPLPTNVSYAARRMLTLSPRAVASLDAANILDIHLPACEQILLGSLSLEVLLHDGRIIRGQVAPELFLCGKRWDEQLPPRPILPVGPEEDVRVELGFA